VSRLLIWFSCGASSAVAAKIVLNSADYLSRYTDIQVLYCKVAEEHSDNLRFLRDCENWLNREIKILENTKYKGSIYNVFKHNYMNTPQGSPCTRALKRQVRSDFSQSDDTHIFGYTYEEEKRAISFETRNPTLLVEWPLIDHILTKENCLAMVKNAGIELPKMYQLGYEHNNCIGCVKGGMGYWNKIRKDFPDVFNKMAAFELAKGYTVLKERVKKPDGTVKSQPLYLKDLDPERGNYAKEPKIECGVHCEYVERQYRENSES
jgi:hypothetical protein